jgi:hypothetical protein
VVSASQGVRGATGSVILTDFDAQQRDLLEEDQEVVALRSKADLTAYLDECKLRARREPTKSLEEIKRLYLIEESVPGPTPHE